MDELKPIKARMLACGEIDLAEGSGRETIENGLLLEVLDQDWRVGGGVYYIVPEAAWNRRANEHE